MQPRGTLVSVAILSIIAVFVMDLPVLAFQSSGPIQHLPLVWTALTGWVKLMVGVSILTTIYGVYVEKRPIPRPV